MKTLIFIYCFLIRERNAKSESHFLKMRVKPSLLNPDGSF
jgi:hypothetical protein